MENNIILSKAQQEKAYTPVRNNYGYGWGIDSVEGKRRVGHGGGIHGFVTNISRIPEDDICIVLLSNASNDALNEITNSIYAIIYNKEYTIPKEKETIKLADEALKQYEGEYTIKPGLNLVIILKDGQLLATATGQPTTSSTPKKKMCFL